MKGGLFAKRFDGTPVNVDDVVRMTGVVLDSRRKEAPGGDSVPSDDGDLPMDQLFSDPTTGGEMTLP